MVFFYILGALIIIVSFYFLFRKELEFFLVGVSSKRRVQKKLFEKCKEKDYLIINELYFPISEVNFRYIDTLIFGDKYLYIVKIVKQAGEVIINLDDNKWRVIYKKSLTNIDNPLFENKKRIKRILEVVPGIKKEDIKSIALFTKTCTFDPINNEETGEYVTLEDEAITLIDRIENSANKTPLDPSMIEKYASSFYAYGKKMEEYINKNKQ